MRNGFIINAFLFYYFIFLFKPVISWRDVTFGIRAMVFKRILGLGEWAWCVL